jgi:hypothetical protein
VALVEVGDEPRVDRLPAEQLLVSALGMVMSIVTNGKPLKCSAA